MKYIALLTTIFCLVAGCTTTATFPVNENLTVNDDEKVLWCRAQEEQKIIDDSGLLYREPELERYLNRIARKLQPKDIPANMSLQIKVIKDPNLNAFAFPNGVIYVHTGILARMDNEAQLAALLAHEITHCTHKHTLRVFKSIKDRPKFISAVQETLARMALAQELAKLLGLTGSMAAVTGYTRELETEADRVGLDLMVKADYDTREAFHLFKHLKQEIENHGIKEPFFFGTHPSVQQRIENIRRWLDSEYPIPREGIKNTEVFQSKLHKIILDNARLDLRIGRFYVAQKGLEKYLRSNPEDAYAYYLLGEIFRQRGQENDAQAAIKYYQKAISLNPAKPEPHKAMGLIHYKVGEKRLAKKFFESCLLLAPDAADKAYIQGYLKLCMSNGGV